MSSRANELAEAVVMAGMQSTDSGLSYPGAHLIDAELRNERERCAERMKAAYDGSGRLRNFRAMYAAILSDEE